MSNSFLLRPDAQGKKDRRTVERFLKKNRDNRSFNRLLLDLLHKEAQSVSEPMFEVRPEFLAGSCLCHHSK